MMVRTITKREAINVAINNIKEDLDAIYAMVNDPEPDTEPKSWEQKLKAGVKDE